MDQSVFAARRAAFRKLHESGCFVIPNPWDVGTARVLEGLGFGALATTSAGFAFSRGLPDAAGAVSREMALRHIEEIVAAVEVPVNADFEAGYAETSEEVAESVALCVATGVAGLSIEDRRIDGLYEPGEAVERVRAARAAIKRSEADVLLTARAECYLVGHPDPLRESVRRLQAYAEAGADVLYAPGPKDAAEIRTIVAELAPKPVNFLMASNIGWSVADVAEMGVRRISVGSTLSRVAWTAFLRAAKGIAEDGSFAGFDDCVPYFDLNALFSKSR